MAQYNFLNLPQIEQQAQATRAREQAMGRAKVNAQREDQAYSRQEQQYTEAQKYQSLARMLAGVRVINEQFAANKPDQAFAAAEQIAPWLAQNGDYNIEGFDPDLITPETMAEAETRLTAALQQFKPVTSDKTDNVTKTWVRPDTGTMYGMRSSGETFDTGIPAQQYAMKTTKVPMQDGSEMVINYNPATGEGFGLNGQRFVVRPGGNGQSLVYGEEGLIGPGQEVSAPAGFGRSQTPGQKQTQELEAKEEFGKEAEVNQALESLYGVLQIRPVLERARDDLSWANSGAMFWTTYIPGTTGNNLRSDIETVTANLGFDKLARMRELSSSGASGLGQLSNNELRFLQSTLRNFRQTQSYDRLDSNFRDVMKAYDRWSDAWAKDIAKNGTREQFAEYYDMLPAGSLYYHPKTGEKKVKR